MNLYKKIVLVLLFSVIIEGYGQQDPQFTQYMYNTMTVNPAYAGTQGHSVITLLGRTQWVGFDGAPDTQTLSLDTPLNWKNLGLGLNLMNDVIGPTQEIYADLNLSYTIRTSEEGNLAFGLKGGVRMFNLNKSKLDPREPLTVQLDYLDKKFFPTFGAGIYYFTKKYYLGLAVPNIVNSKHYNGKTKEIARERYHFFGIAGIVFDLSDKVKFKPAALVKAVEGAPLSVDLSANFLINNKIHAGLAWRWDDSISALLGFQINDKFHIGYAYDLTTSPYKVTNSGSHELLLRYHFLKPDVVISPRFF